MTAFIVAEQNQMVSINETPGPSSMSETDRSQGNGIKVGKSMKSLMHPDPLGFASELIWMISPI